jgi:pentatricopeptide repeat protein
VSFLCHPRAERPDEALSLLKTMRSYGIAPDVVSYNSAIKACGRGGRYAEACGLQRKEAIH